MGKLIKKFEVEYDSMVVINLVEALNESLIPYKISVEVEEEDHDGFEVIIVREISDFDID
jgi:hypothetical protein